MVQGLRRSHPTSFHVQEGTKNLLEVSEIWTEPTSVTVQVQEEIVNRTFSLRSKDSKTIPANLYSGVEGKCEKDHCLRSKNSKMILSQL